VSKINLNDMTICSDDGGFSDKPQKDYGYRSDLVDVHFKNIKRELIRFITNAEHILGCVAWLTDPDILDALSSVSCSIFVQKEDFLRPDVGSDTGFKKGLRAAYARLSNKHLVRFMAPGVLSGMSYCGDPEIDAVRVVGNHNRSKHPAFPRMHNKFLVACRIEAGQKFNGESALKAYAAWTGSFNFTKNAGMSFENAVVLRNPEIAAQFANEWSQIGAFSEPLNWNSDWCAPEWRIGS